jgi:hypothetical protein
MGASIRYVAQLISIPMNRLAPLRYFVILRRDGRQTVHLKGKIRNKDFVLEDIVENENVLVGTRTAGCSEEGYY